MPVLYEKTLVTNYGGQPIDAWRIVAYWVAIAHRSDAMADFLVDEAGGFWVLKVTRKTDPTPCTLLTPMLA